MNYLENITSDFSDSFSLYDDVPDSGKDESKPTKENQIPGNLNSQNGKDTLTFYSSHLEETNYDFQVVPELLPSPVSKQERRNAIPVELDQYLTDAGISGFGNDLYLPGNDEDEQWKWLLGINFPKEGDNSINEPVHPIEIDKVKEEIIAEQEPPRRALSVKRKRTRLIVQDEKGSLLTETPTLAFRRSLRARRLLQDKLKVEEITTNKKPVQSPFPPLVKTFGRIDDIQNAQSKTQTHEGTVTKLTSKNDDRPPIKIFLLRSKPANPIDTNYIRYFGFRNKLMNPYHELGAEQFLKHATNEISMIEPKGKVKESLSYAKDNLLDISKINELQKLKWMEQSNLVAVAKAHGSDKLGWRKNAVTPEGNLKRALPLINFDKSYDELLAHQNNLRISPFQDPSYISEVWNNQLRRKRHSEKKLHFLYENNSIFGAVKIDHLKYERSRVFKGKGQTFTYNGNHYKLNPPVIWLEKLSDDLLEQVMSPPQVPTLDSKFYSLMANYFDKNSEENP